MTRETLYYLREKINAAERILQEKQTIDRMIEKITASDFTSIQMLVGEGGSMVKLRFAGDRKKLVEILERRREELLKKYEDL